MELGNGKRILKLIFIFIKMKKLDYSKDQKEFYSPKSDVPVIIDVPEFNFLMIDGKGNPNTSKDYQKAVEALFGLAYTLKFLIKKGIEEIDYKVYPLEGLWWADDMSDFANANKDNWFWTMMIRQPEVVTKEHFALALEQLKKKKPEVDFSGVRFAQYCEGKAAQLMHLGPFTTEGPDIAKIHEFIKAQGGKVTGKHHEIYLSDIRKAAPEKWKTVLRQPFK